MARVDFYILPDGSSVDRFACSITGKAWSKGNRVHIHTASEQAATMLDNLLWTFRDISFVPHELFAKDQTEDAPVTIGYGPDYPNRSQVIINLDNSVPEFVAKFERIVEIVGGDENNKRYARQRYRQYRDNDYEVHNHTIDNAVLND